MDTPRTTRPRTNAQAQASRLNGRKCTPAHVKRADPDDLPRYAVALEKACRELVTPAPHPAALIACPDCERYAPPAVTVHHLTRAHLEPATGRLPPPQSAARIIARVLRREYNASKKAGNRNNRHGH